MTCNRIFQQASKGISISVLATTTHSTSNSVSNEPRNVCCPWYFPFKNTN